MERQDYIQSGRNTVAGWFTLQDAILFDVIDASQRSAGITGDLLEIGCYQGTSAVMLGYMRQENEQLLICDLFDGVTESPEDQAERERYYTPAFGRQMFEDNFRRFHAWMPEVHAQPSSTMHSMGLGQTFRFIHIDGSHAYDQVRQDLLLAKRLLKPGGVVVFDDLLSHHTPGVTSAVWEGVANDGLIPLFQTIKFYGAWGDVPTIDVPFPKFPHIIHGYEMFHLEG